MALDATPSGAASDSYATLAEATAYHLTRLHSEEWAASVDAKREAALKWATQLIDQLETPSGSQKYLSTQKLRWPRSYVYDLDGTRLPTNIVPDPIRSACCEMAYHLLVDDRTAESGLLEVDTITVGPLTIKKDRFAARAKYPQSVVDYLRPYVSSFGSGRVMRA